MNSFIEWVASTTLHDLVLGPAWMWPMLEIFHFFGLCLLIGALLFIDLRMLGFFKKMSIAATHELLPFVFVGFGINLISGVLFFFGNPERYSINIAFQLKMLLVVLAGMNALLYFWKISPKMDQLESSGGTFPLAKVVGASSLVFWFGVLIFGRMIPYMGTG